MLTVPGIVTFEAALMQEVSVVVWTRTALRTAGLNVRERSNDEAPLNADAEIGITIWEPVAPVALSGPLIVTGAAPNVSVDPFVWEDIAPPLRVAEIHDTEVDDTAAAPVPLPIWNSTQAISPDPARA